MGSRPPDVGFQEQASDCPTLLRPNWPELMREISEKPGLDVGRETNLVPVAQYHLNERGNRTRINQKIIDESRWQDTQCIN